MSGVRVNFILLNVMHSTVTVMQYHPTAARSQNGNCPVDNCPVDNCPVDNRPVHSQLKYTLSLPVHSLLLLKLSEHICS